MTAARTRTAKAATLRAVVYIRLSSHRGDADPSTSPARQEASCRAYCAAKGWEVVEVIQDLDVSGTAKGKRLERPGLNKIRDLWGSVDIVIFAKLDRLARNVIDFRAFADEADEHGAALVSVAESLDLTTPSGRFVATILAAFAEMEGEVIAERTLAGHQAARELGRWTGGRVPFGFKVAPHPSGKGKTLVHVPEEVKLIRAMVRDVLDRDKTLYAIARDLNAAGTLNRGHHWRNTQLRRMLTSAAIVGRWKVGNDYVRAADGEPLEMWPPVVTLADWHALRVAITPVGATGRTTRKRADFLLSGIVRCAACGGPCNADQGSDGIRRRYRCSTAPAAPGRCERGTTIQAAPLEKHVVAKALESFGSIPTSRREVVELDDGRRADIELSLAALARQITEPGADVAAIAARIAAFSAERDALPATAARQVRIVPTGKTWGEEFAEGDLAKRRSLLAEVLTVYVGPGTRGHRGIEESRVSIEGPFDPLADANEAAAAEEALT